MFISNNDFFLGGLMKRYSVMLSCMLITALLGAAGIQESMQPVSDRATTAENNQDFFMRSVQQFSDQLFFVDSFKEKNAMVSPLSVLLALGMTTNGAEGSTLSSTLDVLVAKVGTLQQFNDANTHYLNSISDLSDIELSIANSLWLNNQVRFDKGFLTKSRDIYHATAKNLDFSAKSSLNAINSWVNEATRGTITSILDSLDPAALLYLINAVYFKGDWENPFTKESTYPDTFILKDTSVQAPFMHQSSLFPYAKALDAQMVMMPYSNDRYAFVALLPSEGTDLETWLAGQKEQGGFTQRMFSSVESLQNTHMDLAIPKFEASYKDSLVDELKQLGIRDPFDGKKADFSLMTESRSKEIVITEVLHKTFIRVDEQGSEAAAVTSVMMKATSMPIREKLSLRFDRPFFYAIIDREYEIPLFMGTMENPLAE